MSCSPSPFSSLPAADRFHVRALTAADLPGLLDIQRACYGEDYAESGEVFARRLAGTAHCSLALEQDGRVRAYLAAYRSLIWPDHRRLAGWAHEKGLKFIYHTDGDVNGVVDLYIQAGFDCLQPLEAKARMDIRTLIPRYGDRLAFFGNIDIRVLSTNDPDQVEEELRSKLEAGKSRRGYIFHSDHSVPPAVSWKTYQHVIRLLNNLGKYD